MDSKALTLMQAIHLVETSKEIWKQTLTGLGPQLQQISPNHNTNHGKIDCPLCYVQMLSLQVITRTRQHIEPVMFSLDRSFTLNDYLYNQGFSNAVLKNPLNFDQIMALSPESYHCLEINPISVEIKYPDKLYGLRYVPIRLIQQYLGQNNCGIKIELGRLE
jgi:hypothetical protein